MRTIARTLFSFRGRLSLGGFWAGVIGAAFVVIAAFIVTGTVGGRTAQYLVHPFALWWLAALAVKRLHDRDCSGWWLLVALIPIVGPLWLAITLALRAGTPGDNRFGADPRMRDSDYLVVA